MQFPAHFLIDKSTWSSAGDDGSIMDRADDGTPHVRRLWESTRYSVSFNVVGMTAQEVSELRQFYRDTRMGTVDFADPVTGDAMEVVMLREPEITAVVGAQHTMRIVMDAKYL